MNNLPYDKKSKESIENYALKLKGKTFKSVIDNDPNLNNEDRAILYEYYNNSRNKGGLGNLIEKHYFFYDNNSNPEADFNEAGVELKVTPYIRNNYNSVKAKERLVLSMINYLEDYKSDFENSHVYKKCALMLLIYYLYNPTKGRIDYVMNYIKLFQFPEADLEIIKKDYEIIINKIKEGKAHEISEGDTNYLGACTKGANSDSVQEQPFNKDIPAKRRAFCLKNSYMTYILNNYLVNNSNTESIVKDSKILKEKTLEEYITEKLSTFYNQSVQDLSSKFDLNVSAKSFTFDLAKKMLNVVNNKIEEFEKANIKIKAIRLNKNGMPEESMSFPAFRYMDIINETWENSKLYEMFSTNKYLFMIFQYNKNNNLIFKKAKFWNVPGADLETEIKRVWLETVKRIKNNQYNDLPKIAESPILHVRPHAQNSKDTYPTPDGKQAVKKCFWLNASYIKKQIESED